MENGNDFFASSVMRRWKIPGVELHVTSAAQGCPERRARHHAKEPRRTTFVSRCEAGLLAKAERARNHLLFAAQEIVAKYPFKRIENQLEVFDWKIANGEAPA
jgi:hypothetical protein